MSSYDFEVKYQASSKHGNADALSHLPLDTDEDWLHDEAHETVCLLRRSSLTPFSPSTAMVLAIGVATYLKVGVEIK